MKINIFEISGITYILGFTYYFITRIGDMPSNPQEPYHWTMALMAFVFVFIPFVLGVLAGISERRKY